jgi:DNA-binding MarR family transcriptional regulator
VPPGVGKAAVRAVDPLFLREEELERAVQLLHRAHRRLAHEARSLRESGAIDEVDQFALMLVAEQPGTTLADIAQALGESKQMLSRHLRKLTRGGLLLQGTTTGDRRKRPLSLTASGHELVQRLVAAEKRSLRAAFKEVGPEAVEGFKTVVRELAGEARRPRGLRVGGARPW